MPFYSLVRLASIVDYPVFNSSKQSIFDVRRRARIRAFVCPGAGFAALGYRPAAWLTYAAFSAGLITAIITALFPAPEVFWCAVGLGALAALLWFVELATAHSDQIDVAPEPGPLSNWHWIGAGLLWAAAMIFLVLVVSFYALFTVGPEMAPTLRNGKRLLVRRTVDPQSLVPGKLIVFRLSVKNQKAEPGSWTIGRILAVPGDRISLLVGRYVVNGLHGRPAASAFDHFAPVVVAEHPAETKVPPGCYFITQDSPTHGSDSAVLSWAVEEDVVSTKFFELSFSRLLRPLDEAP